MPLQEILDLLIEDNVKQELSVHYRAAIEDDIKRANV